MMSSGRFPFIAECILDHMPPVRNGYEKNFGYLQLETFSKHFREGFKGI